MLKFWILQPCFLYANCDISEQRFCLSQFEVLSIFLHNLHVPTSNHGAKSLTSSRHEKVLERMLARRFVIFTLLWKITWNPFILSCNLAAHIHFVFPRYGSQTRGRRRGNARARLGAERRGSPCVLPSDGLSRQIAIFFDFCNSDLGQHFRRYIGMVLRLPLPGSTTSTLFIHVRRYFDGSFQNFRRYFMGEQRWIMDK